MVRNPKRYWKLNKIRTFKSDFRKLSSQPYAQWRISKTIELMLSMKDPSKVYKFTICRDRVKDLYLFGIADDGLGNKGIELQIYLDRNKNILSPITVRKVRKPRNKKIRKKK